MCSWSVDFCSSEVTLIPWSALKKGFDRLIQFDPIHKCLYMGHISDYPCRTLGYDSHQARVPMLFSPPSLLPSAVKFCCASLACTYRLYLHLQNRSCGWHSHKYPRNYAYFTSFPISFVLDSLCFCFYNTHGVLISMLSRWSTHVLWTGPCLQGSPIPLRGSSDR